MVLLLHIRPEALGQAQRQRTGKRRAEGRDLYRHSLRLPAEEIGGDHAQPCDLGDSEIGEHDAAPQHLLPEHQQTRQKCRAQDGQIQAAHDEPAAASRR